MITCLLTNKALDPIFISNILLGIAQAGLCRRQHPELQFVIAGGLSVKKLPSIKPIVEKFPSISIDAQGALRNEGDHLDVAEAEKYLHKAVRILKG
ncbi:MAG: hypothetical protein NTZ97_03825 [Candidatus Moranbacteria bacterium]|nr:hypothetical protein [Candidatus Moranbacteria bacterium]